MFLLVMFRFSDVGRSRFTRSNPLFDASYTKAEMASAWGVVQKTEPEGGRVPLIAENQKACGFECREKASMSDSDLLMTDKN